MSLGKIGFGKANFCSANTRLSRVMRSSGLMLLLLPCTATGFAQSVDASLAASLSAHGGSMVVGVQTIVIVGHPTIGKTTPPIRRSASLDGNLRLDYGQPVTRSIV